MSTIRFPAFALVAGASLAAAAAFGQSPIPPKIPHPATEVAEEEDLELTQSALQGSSGALRPAGISVAAGTTLTPPVTITYSGSSVALTINDSGTNRGLNSLLTNTTNTNSAVFGQTAGVASGVKGVSTGTSGYGGSFAITNAANAKPALYATTNGTGSAILATSTQGYGINAHSTNNYGIYASSDINVSIWGQSKNQTAVVGYDSGNGTGVYGFSPSGYGVFGQSSTGYAGYFDGKVGAFSFVTLSDRNAKTGFKPVDGGSVLELVSRLPITSWAFKQDPKQRHIGPMAQDFHAAFGLSGTDDKHINLSDAAGVSLVAIQELTKRLQEKDARIAALESMNNAFSARLAKLEASANPQIVTASVPNVR